MRDRLTFSARLIAGEVMCLCQGFDHDGNEVSFVVEPALFHANLERQAHWAGRVELAEEHHRAALETGMSPPEAWMLTKPFLPDDLAMGVSLRVLGEMSG